ncbi:MAG: DUF3990 domain-containing protein [Kiritimatiellae bacterium]|nr:DUF3990 domain-containing protein [Kiritimatiellia bacterium]
MEFDLPNPEMGRRGTDFGQGFYLTPHIESAVNMARRVARRKNSQGAVVICYSLDENQLVSAGLRIRSFLNIEPGWLRLVVANRYFQQDAPDHNLDKRWDVVHGFIADDRIVRLLDALVKGFTTEDEVLKTLRMAQFKSIQYSFHSAAAVSLLKKIEVKHV